MRSRCFMHAGGTVCIVEILREGQPSFACIAAAHEESRQACTLALQDALQTAVQTMAVGTRARAKDNEEWRRQVG